MRKKTNKNLKDCFPPKEETIPLCEAMMKPKVPISNVVTFAGDYAIELNKNGEQIGVAFLSISNAQEMIQGQIPEFKIPFGEVAFLFNLCINQKYKGQGICTNHMMKAVKNF